MLGQFEKGWVEMLSIVLVFSVLFVFIQIAQPLIIIESCEFFQSFDLGYLQPPSVSFKSDGANNEIEG